MLRDLGGEEAFDHELTFNLDHPMGADHEHQAISDQIALLREELNKTPPDGSLIFALLQTLLSMTAAHFKHEEDRMVIQGCPRILVHKKDHEYLVNGLKEFAASVVDETVVLSPSVGESLQSWLKLHIKRFDEAYQKFQNEHS
jgi:hemerythrin-like metal-binding protein